MKLHKTFVAAIMLAAPFFSNADGQGHGPIYADSHAPIGVMGDHRHKQGEWMFSYRYMEMDMKDNLQGEDSISPDAIVTTLANPFANPPMSPPTARVVPVSMKTKMHMFGAMYAPSDDITLMVMLNYLEKTMDHLTYMGGMGSTRLGRFTTNSKGLGDTRVGALVKLYDKGIHKAHINAGLSIPTGDIDKQDTVLSPMNTQPKLRMPYPMQLGSGTYDLLPGVTYYGGKGKIGWGTQLMATIRLGDNSEGYTLGDTLQWSTWSSYRVEPGFSLSWRVTMRDVDSIDGDDDQIRAPIQTANPDNFGGEFIDATLGANFVVQSGALRGHRVALEYSKPIKQDVNGVQMEMQDMLTLGYQVAF